jgi:hypothetical protein
MLKKMTLLTGALLILGFAVAGSFATPRAAEAVCYCAWEEELSTPNNWGKGTSCTAAHNDLLARTAVDARAGCGGATPCLGPLNITTACHFLGGGMYEEDGYRDYACRACVPIEH